MKQTLIIVSALLLTVFGCDSSKKENSNSYSIDAEIAGVGDSTLIYLQLVRDNQLETIDSAYLLGSQVDFNGSLEAPEMIYLKIGDTRKLINLFGENSAISVAVNVDSLDKAMVKGSSIHDDLLEFKSYMEPIDERSAQIDQAYREAASNSDTQRMNEIVEEYNALRNEQVGMIKSFVSSKPNSYISPYIIKSYLSYDMDYPALDSMLVELDTSIYDSKDYQTLNSRVQTLKSVAVGQPAVDFALNDTTGNPIAISSFRGKYLLIDFWASWCGPCRRENPNVVKLYNDFHDKGFDIIGVSFDEDGRKWIDAINQDKLTWPHVSDLKGWSSAAGKLYAISSIPATVLLDRDGIIVAKNLRGDALRQKLEELYTEEEKNL